MIGKKHTEETKLKMSESRRGKLHPMYGKHHSEDSKKKMSDSAKARPHLPTTLGRVWVNNGETSRLVNLCDFDYYISRGFIKGRLFKSKNN